ncbi:MAG: glycerol kinase GlpK [Burkholderiaceae bacterium]|nr:glycerol kinase GlpK [Burkholderiaceae bacterium]
MRFSGYTVTKGSNPLAANAQYILALDQGTTSSRAILVDRFGNSAGMAQQEFRQFFPQPGWVEHDAAEIWDSQLAVIREVLSRGVDGKPVAADQLRAIAITNQRETTVLWDRATGKPLANAIVWQDRRTRERCTELQAQGRAADIQARTGLLLDPYFSATKLQWLLDTLPGARERARRGELAFGTIDTWLAWNLTAGRVHATDPSNASRTMLLDLHTLQWDETLLELFDIPHALLPAVVPTSGVIGESDPGLLGCAVPIAAMVGDQQAAMFGQACFSRGMAKNTYGTGCFMLLNTGEHPVPSHSRLLTTVGWQLGRPQGTVPVTTYCLEASVFMGGATIQWLRDGLGIIGSAPEVEALAASVPDVADTYLVPAFTGLGAPIWDSDARATLIGMTRGTTRAHIARAALEGIALQVVDVFDAMQRDSGIALAELRVDGGASKNDLLMQMQADFLGIPVVRPRITETTALGAAYLAGLATEIWHDTESIESHWTEERRFEPAITSDQREAKLDRWHQAVERSEGWANP